MRLAGAELEAKTLVLVLGGTFPCMDGAAFIGQALWLG